MNNLQIRAVKIVLTLQKGAFANDNNQKTMYCCSLPGYLYCDVNISRAPGWQGNTAQLTVYGMTTEDCLTAMKFNSVSGFLSLENQVEIYAGYITPVAQRDLTYKQADVTKAIDALPLVYRGAITSASPDFNNVDRPFSISSIMSLSSISSVLPPLNLNASSTLDSVINDLIAKYKQANPDGIQYKLGSIYPVAPVVSNGHYSSDDFIQQITQLCEDYGYHAIFRFADGYNIIDISLIGQASPSAQPNIISADNGMIGYPVVLPFGVQVNEYFQPTRSVNDIITLKTYVTPLDSSKAGDYVVWQQSIQLETQGDNWLSVLLLYGKVSQVQ